MWYLCYLRHQCRQSGKVFLIRGKEHFLCQWGFQLVSEIPTWMEKKVQYWRWGLQGWWNGLEEAEGPVCSSFTLSCVKPFLQLRKAETSSIPLNYPQDPSAVVSAVALSESKCLQCSSPASPCSFMGKYSCRTGSSTSQSQALMWILYFENKAVDKV